MTQLRLGGDDLPRRLLAAALEWSGERLGTVVGGCALLSPRHEPIRWAWGSAHAERADGPASIAERLQHRLFPLGEPSTLARAAETDPMQPPVVVPAADDLGGCAEAIGRHGIASPLFVVLRIEGHVAGLIWIAGEAPGASQSSSPADDDVRALRLAQPLLELALRERWYHGGPDAAIGGDLADRGLTPRQEEVARLAVQGLGNAAIAARLGIGERTVKNHMTGVLTKCGVRTRTRLIALYGPSDSDT